LRPARSELVEHVDQVRVAVDALQGARAQQVVQDRGPLRSAAVALVIQCPRRSRMPVERSWRSALRAPGESPHRSARCSTR
jgi:hypothetical protein